MKSEDLPIEAQFSIAQFNAQVEHMSPEQAKQMLRFTHEHLQLQKHSYNELLKKAWGIGEPLTDKGIDQGGGRWA